MTIGLTWRRTARRIKRLKEAVLTISTDYSIARPPTFWRSPEETPIPALRDGVSYQRQSTATGFSVDLTLPCFIFRLVPPLEKLRLNEAWLTNKSLDFGCVRRALVVGHVRFRFFVQQNSKPCYQNYGAIREPWRFSEPPVLCRIRANEGRDVAL